MKRILKKLSCLFLILLLIETSGCNKKETVIEESTIEENKINEVTYSVDTSNYTLEEMVVLSRHNIRSPLSDGSSTIGQMTTHSWYNWSSPSSELSSRGGTQETAFGQYFRKYLIDKGLIVENWMPEEKETRFYANSLQRTIATTRYFATGMLPASDVNVEYHEEFGTMDPVFNPQLTYVSEAYQKQVMDELNALDEDGINGITAKLADAYEILEKVLDFKDSTYAKENNITEFSLDDTEIILEENKEPKMAGSLKLASSAADALVLQYYENSDEIEAAFGNELSEDDWKKLASIKDTYQELLFGSYSEAINTAHPLLIELESELQNSERKFSYLCGHDSNIKGVMVALNGKTRELPGSLNSDSPIGCKLVFEKWLGKDGKQYVTLKLVYQSTEQLRNNALLDLNNPPEIVEVSLDGLNKNSDGLYLYDDIIARFNEAINAYNELP